MMNNIWYFNIILFIISLTVSIYYINKYLKIKESLNYNIEVKAKVTYVNSMFYGYYYKTFVTYQYKYQGFTYEAFDKGYGKDLVKLGDEVKLLINPSNPKKCFLPLNYRNKEKYLLYGIVLLIFSLNALVNIISKLF